MKGDGKALRRPQGLELGRRPGRRSNLLINEVEYFPGGRTPRSRMRFRNHRREHEALGLAKLVCVLEIPLEVFIQDYAM